MRSLRIPLLVLIFLTVGVAGLRAQELLPSIKQIVDRGEIIVAIVDEDVPPMVMTDKKGKLSGFDISLARVIGRELGVKVKFARVPTFDDIIKRVAAKKADIGMSLLSRTTARARVVLFSRSYIRQTRTLLINRVRGLKFRQTCPTVDEAINLAKTANQIGVIKGSSNENRIKRGVKGENLVRFEAFDDMLKAVYTGKLLASTQGEVAARYYLHTNPFANIRLKLCEGYSVDHIGIAVRPDAPDLVGWINVLLDDRGLDFDADVVIHQDPERILP